MTYLDYLFFIPAILFLVSGLPQMIQLLKTKSSEDVNTWTYFLTCIAILIIIIDAFINHNYSILTSNLVSLLVTGINTFLIVKYKK